MKFVIRQTDDYHTWFTNGSELPHRFRTHPNDVTAGHDSVIYDLELTFDSHNQVIEFEEVDIGKGIDQSNAWLNFYEMYFTQEDQDRSTAQSIRESVRAIALEIAIDAVRRVDGLLSDHHSQIRLNPNDNTSLLAELRDEIVVAMDEIEGFYSTPLGKAELKKILSSFSNGNLALLEDLKYYLADEYDDFVDGSSVLQSATEAVAFDVVENQSSFNVVSIETVTNSNIDFDWTFSGNVTATDVPAVEIRRVFKEGGARSLEQFTSLKSALVDDVGLTYQMVKDREVSTTGVLMQAVDSAQEEASQDAISLFIGEALDFMDGSGLLDLTFTAVKNFLAGMLEGFESANSQYLLPLLTGEPFEFWKGDYQVASRNYLIDRVSFQVDQLMDTLPAQWSNIDPSTSAPEGLLHVDFNSRGLEDGDVGYDSGDIQGKHYTDLMTFSERPFETKWTINVLGRVPMSVRTKEPSLLGPGGHRSIWLNQSMEINFTTTVVVYTGWELEGVDYDRTNELLPDIIDFLDVVWDTIKEPLMDTVDYLQSVSGLLREALSLLLEYGFEAVSDILMDFLRDFGLEHFYIEFAGFTFEIKLTNGREKKECQCGMWVRLRGDLSDLDLDFTTYLIEFEEPVGGVERYMIANGTVGFGHGGQANVTIDPFILIHSYMVEVHATDLNSDGNGWALDMYAPETDTYKTSGTSLSETIGFVPVIPIPMLGIEVGVDFGVDVKHKAPDPGSPPFDFKLAMYGMLRESFVEAWQETEMSFKLEFLEEFIRTAISKFIDKLTNKLEDTILEVVFYLDVVVGAIGSGGSVSGGFRLGFVVDRAVLFELLHWLESAIKAIIANLHNPFDQSPYPSMPMGLPEYLGVRLEVYFGVAYPKMLRSLSSAQTPKNMDMAVSIQPNVPALMMLAGVDWGRWRIDFGAYLENFPLNSLGNVQTLDKGVVVDLYLLKGQIYEIDG
jgi:hypothetical protein